MWFPQICEGQWTRSICLGYWVHSHQYMSQIDTQLFINEMCLFLMTKPPNFPILLIKLHRALLCEPSKIWNCNSASTDVNMTARGTYYALCMPASPSDRLSVPPSRIPCQTDSDSRISAKLDALAPPNVETDRTY